MELCEFLDDRCCEGWDVGVLEACGFFFSPFFRTWVVLCFFF